ncbi:CYTH domain-containing protein [Leptospira sp. WS92.C1]
MEIERKFLVLSDQYKRLGSSELISQGYLNSDKNRTVRVRIQGSKATLTIKSATVEISREEYEYEIPLNDAKELLNRVCEKPIIEKTRYKIEYQNFVWEVDEFFGDNLGLVVAEIELEYPEQKFNKPDWIGEEVSHDQRYFNSSLIKNPFKNWHPIVNKNL